MKYTLGLSFIVNTVLMFIICHLVGVWTSETPDVHVLIGLTAVGFAILTIIYIGCLIATEVEDLY